MTDAAAVRRADPAAAWPGLLPVDKPGGITSHDVVARARRALGIGAVGHLGTLDPAATGLLVLALGAATRCAAVWQGGAKTYAGVARFGIVTDSQDTSGAVIATSDVRPSAAEVSAAAARLTGSLAQVPPMVSALKQGGERLYAIARRGETVARAPRSIRVDAWRWLEFGRDAARFEVDCSGGTYVRTLVHDLGALLGCGAALAELRRLRSEPFHVAGACSVAELDERGAAVLERHGVPLDRALDVLPAVTLDEAAAEAIGRGQQPLVTVTAALPVEGDPRGTVFRDATGRALALGSLGVIDGVRLRARPAVVFPWAVRAGRRE